MQGMTTVIVVHETAAPEKKCLVALCDEHTVILHKAAWARVAELVGFSTTMECEACTLIDPAISETAAVSQLHGRHDHLQPLPTTA